VLLALRDCSPDSIHLVAIGCEADIPPPRAAYRLDVIDHLRHQRAIFAVMHTGVLAQRYGNVRA
jgi:hypothetical protein